LDRWFGHIRLLELKNINYVSYEFSGVF
jgi:hypothetical protein